MRYSAIRHPMNRMLQVAFTLLGTDVTWLELVAFALALACVVCNTLEIHWGWPLAIASSGLYGWLFFASRLYGDVAVQGYFVVSSAWGWWEWLFGRRRVSAGDSSSGGDESLRVARMPPRARFAIAALWLAMWPLAGVLLGRFTNTDVPYFDAFPTAGSFIGQALLGLKYVESWPVWILVNIVGAALYAYKSLDLTALLYAVFAVLSVVGWRRWSLAPALGGAAR